MSTLQLSGAIILGKLASAPSNPKDGMLYFDTGTNKFRFYRNSGFHDIPSTAEVEALVSAAIDAVDLTPLEDAIAALTLRVDDLEAADIALDGRLDTAESDITAIEGRLDTAESDIDAAEGRLDTAEADIDALELDVAGKIDATEKGAVNGVATLNASGKLTTSQIPAIALVDTFQVNSEAAMLALSDAEQGDVAIRSDIMKSFILVQGGSYDTLADWKELLSPTDQVQSVNGQQGTVVLDTGDIDEGSNLYFTDERAQDAVAADIATAVEAEETRALAAEGLLDGRLDVVEAALPNKLENVVEDLTPQLGGDLDMNAKALTGDMKRGALGGSNFIVEKYLDAISLLGSQTDTAIASLQFAHASFEGCEITCKVKEATSGDVKIATIRIVTNGTAISINEVSVETADTGITFSAAIVGANVEVRYSSGSNGATMRADVKLFRA